MDADASTVHNAGRIGRDRGRPSVVSQPMFVATTLAISLALSPVTPLGLLLGHGGAAPRPYAWMAPAPSAPGCAKLEPRVSLQVDTQALSDDAQGVGNRLRSKAEREIQGFDLMLGGAEAKDIPAVVIKIVPLVGEDEGFSYTIDINHATATPIKDGSSVGECKLCTESELLEKVAGSTRALMPKLRGYITDYNNKPCEPLKCKVNLDCVGNPDGSVCDVPTGRCHRPGVAICQIDADCKNNPIGPICDPVEKRCIAAATPPDRGMNGKQKAGIGLLVGGALGVGIGVGLVVKKPTPTDKYTAWETRETQKPGFVLLAVGGAALVTGIVLFALGRRERTRSQVGPMAGTGTYGLSWSGRF